MIAGRQIQRFSGKLVFLVVSTSLVAVSFACLPQYIQSDSRQEVGSTTASRSTARQEGIKHQAIRPNIMLLVDRSGSMAEPIECEETTCPSKWEQLVTLGAYLEEVGRSANVGLSLFPSPSDQGCGAYQYPTVPLSNDAVAHRRVLNALKQTRPGGRTPLSAALAQIERNGGLNDPERENILVILTDGRPNCMCDSGQWDCERQAVVAAVQRLVSRDPPVVVNVIGFGSSARAAHETLTAIARTYQGNDYYQADTIEDLIGRLYNLVIATAPCSFSLDDLPEPRRLIVWVDENKIHPCNTDPCESGYIYSRSEGRVELRGETCNAIRDGERHRVWFDEGEAAPTTIHVEGTIEMNGS